MKIVVSISIVILIYVSSSLGLFNTVDISGIYYSEQSNPKIIMEQLQLKDDQRFEYFCSVLDGVASNHTISGHYDVQGSQLKFFPEEFKNHSTSDQKVEQKINTAIKSLRGARISSKTHPEAYKKRLTYFESGVYRLKPAYYIKQLNGRLSLCLSDVKTEQFHPEFSKR